MSIEAIAATKVAIIQGTKIFVGFAVLAAMIGTGINVIPDACSISGFYIVLCLNCVLFCGKMQEIIFNDSLFFLTSIFQTSAMELTKRSLIIIPTFLVAQEKKISVQLLSQK